MADATLTPDSYMQSLTPDSYMAEQTGAQQANSIGGGGAQPSISSAPEAQGIGDRLARWAQNAMEDVRNGTDLTGVGTVLKKMGAHGLNYGAPEKVAEFMGSMPLGVLQGVQGAGELMSGQPWEGAKNVVGGTLKTAEIPSLFVAPDAGTAALEGGASKLSAAIPSEARATRAFQEVMGAARYIPVDTTAPGASALQLQHLADSGATMPKVASDFLKRITDPNKGPLNYGEARDFYTNATRLSSDEISSLTPVMRKAMGDFTQALNSSIEGAAAKAGKLPEFRNAMNEYAKAMRLKAWGEGLKTAVTSDAAKAAAGAGAGAAGAYAVRELLK